MIYSTLFISTPLTKRKNVISIVIEKEKANSKINRLEIIDKCEVDHNSILKLYWPKITNRIAEKNGTLGKNQVGNQKNKSATDTVLINEFIIDTASINQQPLTIQ